MIYVGLDLSLNRTGFVVTNGNKIIKRRIINAEKLSYIYEKINKVFIVIKNFISDNQQKHHNILFVIENYAFSKRGDYMTKAAELGGLIKYWLWKKNLKFMLISPITLKKFATGNTKCGKDLVLLKVYKKYGIEFEDNNECDAFVLTKLGELFFERNPENDYEKHLLEKILKLEGGEDVKEKY